MKDTHVALGVLDRPSRLEAVTLSVQEREFVRLVNLFRKVCRDYKVGARNAPWALQWRDHQPYLFGRGEPDFTVVVNDRTGAQALASFDGLTFVEAYVLGHLDIQGSMERMYDFRDVTSDNHPLYYVWNLVKPLLFGQTRMDRSGISAHYDSSEEFFLNFLDTRHRCYSQGVFERDDESLEDAMTRKLTFAMESIDAKPGDHVLDIGGGWGAFTEFAGKRGVRVTSLTISRESEKYLHRLIARETIPGTVVNCHLYEYDPGIKFDAIVNLGVTEHLPDYKRSLAMYQRLLKPGGKMYLDASACREKYKFHSFITKHIYPGNCSPLCLHDYMKHLDDTPLRLRGVWDDRHSYHLTAKRWGQNIDRNRDTLVRHSDEATFRKFRMYIWGTADVFNRDVMQAYRWVLELPA